MEPRIEPITQKTLVGKRITMSYAENKTAELWRSFSPRRGEIKNPVSTDLYSVEVYPPAFFDTFNPAVPFEKWAALEVSDPDSIPSDMESFTLPAGLYAVFLYVGPASVAQGFYQFIFAEWLPDSAYVVADRPHFALMGENYKGEDPDSKEEIWIPIARK